MNKHVFEITNEIVEKLMNDKSCKIAHISVEPNGDSIHSIRSSVNIQFSVYDREEDCKKA